MSPAEREDWDRSLADYGLTIEHCRSAPRFLATSPGNSWRFRPAGSGDFALQIGWFGG
jgi:hypothetical protein